MASVLPLRVRAPAAGAGAFLLGVVVAALVVLLLLVAVEVAAFAEGLHREPGDAGAEDRHRDRVALHEAAGLRGGGHHAAHDAAAFAVALFLLALSFFLALLTLLALL